MRPREQRLEEALQEFARNQHLPMDILVEELPRRYNLGLDGLREAIENSGLSLRERTRSPRRRLAEQGSARWRAS